MGAKLKPQVFGLLDSPKNSKLVTVGRIQFLRKKNTFWTPNSLY